MSDLSALMEAWDDQCVRRSSRGGRELPTPEIANRLADACDVMATRFGVTTTELWAWMAALRRAGWPAAAVEQSLFAAAECRARLADPRPVPAAGDEDRNQ